jgi:hypothetical protein
MSETELTEEMITAAMAQAESRVCPGYSHCFALPHRLEDVRATCTAKGRCKVGWIIGEGGRDSWEVWVAVRTGRVMLILQTN